MPIVHPFSLAPLNLSDTRNSRCLFKTRETHRTRSKLGTNSNLYNTSGPSTLRHPPRFSFLLSSERLVPQRLQGKFRAVTYYSIHVFLLSFIGEVKSAFLMCVCYMVYVFFFLLSCVCVYGASYYHVHSCFLVCFIYFSFISMHGSPCFILSEVEL